MISIGEVLAAKTYPGRGIVVGKSKDGNYAMTAYFIMGRSENSRNRIFVEDGEGIEQKPLMKLSFQIQALLSIHLLR